MQRPATQEIGAQPYPQERQRVIDREEWSTGEQHGEHRNARMRPSRNTIPDALEPPGKLGAKTVHQRITRQ